jgi:hypothetical protein
MMIFVQQWGARRTQRGAWNSDGSCLAYVWLGAIGRTAGVLEHQREAVFVARQRDRSRRPVSVKFALERIFVFERLDATE